MVLTSSYFLEYIILLGNYQRCAVEVTVFLKIAVNEGSLCDHYIPIKIYAPGIQIIDLDNAGHNKESSWVKWSLRKFLFVVTESDASLECLLFGEYIVAQWEKPPAVGHD